MQVRAGRSGTIGAVETEVTATVVLAVSTAAFLIGLAKGGLPGLGPIVTVIVALSVPATVAIGILLPILMVGDVVALWALRGHVDRSIVRAVIPGSVAGVGLASFILSSLSAGALELGIVVIVVVFVAYRTAVLTNRAPTLGADSMLAGHRAGAVAGLATGVTSTIAHAGGPPVAMYLLAREVTPIGYAATSAAIFWATNWLKVPGYALAGLLDMNLILTLAPTAVLILPGVLCGRWAVKRFDPRPFEVFVLIGLLIGAVLLIVT